MKIVLLSLAVIASTLTSGELKDYPITENSTKFYVKTNTKLEVAGNVRNWYTSQECAMGKDFSAFDVYERVNKKLDINYEIFSNPKNVVEVIGYNPNTNAYKLIIYKDKDYFKAIEVVVFNKKSDCAEYLGQDVNYSKEEKIVEDTNYSKTPELKLSFELGKKYKMANGETTGKIGKATTWDEYDAAHGYDYTDGKNRWDIDGYAADPDNNLVLDK